MMETLFHFVVLTLSITYVSSQSIGVVRCYVCRSLLTNGVRDFGDCPDIYNSQTTTVKYCRACMKFEGNMTTNYTQPKTNVTTRACYDETAYNPTNSAGIFQQSVLTEPSPGALTLAPLGMLVQAKIDPTPTNPSLTDRRRPTPFQTYDRGVLYVCSDGDLCNGAAKETPLLAITLPLALFAVLKCTASRHPSTLAEILKSLRIVPAPPPSDVDSASITDIASAVVLREHAKHAAGLKEDHEYKKSQKPQKTDRAWFFPYGQEKLAHLLLDPVCICGVNVDEFSIHCKNGEISLILDTYRNIDANRCRRGDAVSRLIPEELEQRIKFGVPPAVIQQDEHKVSLAHHTGHKIPLPRLHPAGANQMRHTAKNVDKVVEAWGSQGADSQGSGDFTAEILDAGSPMVRLMTTVYEEQCLYNAVFFEAIRQCTVHFAERGQFLADIRRSYTALLQSVPNLLKAIHQELLMQRSIDRRLVEHFIGYKEWWDGTRFRFDTIKQSGEIGRTITARCKDLPDNNRLVFLLDDDSKLFKGYIRLFENQRTTLLLDQNNMAFECERWQDLTHLLSTRLMENPNFDEFHQLHNVQSSWLENAREIYQRIVLHDEKQVLTLREQTKAWLSTLSQLEKRLSDNENAVFTTLTSIRLQVEETVRQFFDREGPADEELKMDITDRLRKWISELVAVLSRFQAALAKQNLQFAEKVHTLFERLVVSTLTALVTRYKRERAFATGPLTPTDPSQSTRILRAMDPVQRLGPSVRLEEEHDSFIENPLNVLVGEPTDAPPPAKTDPFNDSLDIFLDLLRRYRIYDADLTLLQNSHPYIELYSLWQRYHALQPSFQERTYGNEGLLIEIANLEESMEQILSLATDSRSNYFNTMDPDRFSSAAFGFIHTIDQILMGIRTKYHISALLSEPPNNLIRKLIQNARTWSLFTESHLKAMTHGVMTKVSEYSEKMLRIGIDLLVTVLPDQDFDEKRYLQLYKKGADMAINDKLDLMELQLTALCLEHGNFSHALDEESVLAGNATKDHTFGKSAEWKRLADSLLRTAYVINDINKSQLHGTTLSRYKKKVEAVKTAVAERDFSLDELLALIDTKVDTHDFVEFTNLGDEVNIYVKPYAIATTENVDRECDPHTTDYTEEMLVELDEQKERNAKTQQRVRELQDGLSRAKAANQQLNAAVQVLRKEQSEGVPVQPKLTEETMTVIELITWPDPDVPEVMRPGALPPMEEQETIPDWEALLRGSSMPDSAPSVFFSAQNRPVFGYLNRMAEIEVLLQPHQLKLMQLMQVIEPLLEPDLELQATYEQRKADRDQKRADRWVQCQRIREERHKAQNA
ncbi:hypothetical protein BV898_18555 [Hypsibius exemplaris]|uniref:Uncharacterized protein n=1 Tax=Hypsibius exemplaris TaxID=2072580 RepID=A0A9X6RN53_HYPEX|nr:hypothetical protein BV898_18555 [Hypsibius exemplaris]